MVAVLIIVILVVFGFLGLFQWMGSELPLAIREIALNGRKELSTGSSYRGIEILSVLMKVLAVVTWVAGLLVAVLGPSQIEAIF